MSSAISTTFDFERVAITLGTTPYDAYGQAVVTGDRRTWKVTAIQGDLVELGPERRSVSLSWIKEGTPLFGEIRVAIHRQCGTEISERMNRAVEEQGGYEILFGEAMPADRFERGRDSFGTPDRVWPLAA